LKYEFAPTLPGTGRGLKGTDYPSDGSSFEVYFTSRDGEAIQQYFIVPDRAGKKAKILDRELKEVEGVTSSFWPAGAGYEVEVELPLKKIGLPNGAPFLFDMIVNITTLGDAHSGGRASLSGGFDSLVDSTRFHHVSM
jgi:hypothetical protein